LVVKFHFFGCFPLRNWMDYDTFFLWRSPEKRDWQLLPI